MILIVLILLLFTLLLFHVGRHTRSNRYLGIYFIGQIVVLANMAFHPFTGIVHLIFQSIIFSWGAFYFLFVASLLDKQYIFKPNFLVHLLPVPIGFFFISIDYYLPFRHYFEEIYPPLVRYSRLIHYVLYNGLIIGYNIATVLKYYHFRRDALKGIQLKNTVHKVWLNISVWGFVVSCFLGQIGNYLNRTLPESGFDWMNLGLTAFLVYFCVLFYVAILSRSLLEENVVREKYKSSTMTESEAKSLLDTLEKSMKNERYFTNQELKIKDLADYFGASERNLSIVINKYKNQSFPDFINSYRLEYAKQLLADPLLADKTILWILFESGFNSKATFNTLFKKVVGCTPAEYRKNLLRK